MPAITLTVPRKGIASGKSKVSFETNGFQGDVCTTSSAFLSKALGVVQTDEPTSEMYETPEQAREHLDQGGG